MTKRLLQLIMRLYMKEVVISKKVLVGIVGGIIILVLAFFAYNSLNKKPASSSDDLQTLIQKVGKLIDLPQNEAPTVATVSDKTKLADQPFFKNSQEGDKVLLYYQAKKAILYRPSTNKIIEVAPLNVADQAQSKEASVSGITKEGSASAQPSASPGPKVVLVNAASVSGLATKVETQIKKDLPTFQVIAKANAEIGNQDKTIVVVLNSSSKDQATTLAKALKTEVGSLPEGEKKPETGDIVVFLGKDQK